jgi:Putative zinc-finger
VPGHPSSKLFAGYFRRMLAPAELLALDDHVATCRACRERLRRMIPTRAPLLALRALMESGQPAGQDLAGDS